ncbi:AAA family ATPase [Alteromonas mediterranea]|uniref:AAA family ATPase n=1 Tax=Alteromonas mediterranea TaxID=314275 RepID=UPI002FDF27D7
MAKILIFGNSGSGKSTLARHLRETRGLAHLDLDTLAWKLTSPPERKPIEESDQEIKAFTASNETWVIEGCYTDLLKLVEAQSTEIVFMNLPIESCIANAKARPWEPHKYDTKQAQDDNLPMLIDWIAQYTKRDDTFSYTAHQQFYESYSGSKRMVTQNTSDLKA